MLELTLTLLRGSAIGAASVVSQVVFAGGALVVACGSQPRQARTSVFRLPLPRYPLALRSHLSQHHPGLHMCRDIIK